MNSNVGFRGFGVSEVRLGLRLGLLIFAILFLAGFGIAAESEPSYCCERATSGAWCVNDVESACASGYNAAPTSCSATSYCRLGTCYDSEEGICMTNTPQRVCNDAGGTWDERSEEEVPQCNLGCCVIGDQASFVSLVRCKRLSTFFGVENDWRSDITDELSCISEAQSQDVGACVYENEFELLCEFTTRGECGASEVVEVEAEEEEGISSLSGKRFYKDYLCSAEELGTSCARQASTGCYQGDVYWLDSCGNRENVYSASKDKSWNNGRVLDADEVCPKSDGSTSNCGNCDYLLGTRCAEFEGLSGGPKDGDYYCQRTECVDRDGNERMNGESWCVMDEDAGGSNDRVGSRYYREICDDGVVRLEACGDFRNEVCLEGSIETSDGEFGTAACRVNRWQGCTLNDNEEDCLNIDKGDCNWIPSVLGLILNAQSQGEDSDSVGYSNPTVEEDEDMFTNPTASPITGQAILASGEKNSVSRGGVCVPAYTPGLEFWKEGSAGAICGQANAKCVVTVNAGVLEKISGDPMGDFKDALKEGNLQEAYDLCEDDLDGENCECLLPEWAEGANGVCSALGDCGAGVNYVGTYEGDGYKWVVDKYERFLDE